MAFLKANAGKLALVAVLLVVAAGFSAFSGRRPPAREPRVQYVCVVTGETFWFERGEHKILPAENPKSGERTLVPCYLREDGRLEVSSRCRGLIERLEGDAVNKLVDSETLLVLTEP